MKFEPQLKLFGLCKVDAEYYLISTPLPFELTVPKAVNMLIAGCSLNWKISQDKCSVYFWTDKYKELVEKFCLSEQDEQLFARHKILVIPASRAQIAIDQHTFPSVGAFLSKTED